MSDGVQRHVRTLLCGLEIGALRRIPCQQEPTCRQALINRLRALRYVR